MKAQSIATRSRRTAGALVLALFIGGCGMGRDDGPATTGAETETSAEAGDETAGAADPEMVAQNLEAPWSVAFYKDTPLVSERDSGRILELDDERPAQAREVATLDGVAASGEGGLLGLAVHEDRLFAYSTASSENRIQSFPLSGEPGDIEIGQPETIVDGIAKSGVHNGGRLAFGPDGMLYAAVGDAGDRDDAQDAASLSGSILRMKPDGSVPEDNPSPGSLVYSFGHRNPQGLAWGEDGTMYASEFGQDTWDELNVIEPGGNYGWPVVEGISGDDEEAGADFIDPVQQWAPEEASPSGIAIVDGSILIANLRGEALRQVPIDDLGSSQVRFGGEFGRLRDVVTAPDGDVWIMTNNTDGRGDPGQGDDRILSVESR